MPTRNLLILLLLLILMMRTCWQQFGRDFYAEDCSRYWGWGFVKILRLKGAGYFHSPGQSKGGSLVLELLSIWFSWNFYQIISGIKYLYSSYKKKTCFGPVTCHSWQENGKNGYSVMEFWPLFDIFHHSRRLFSYSKRGVLGFYKQATHRKPGEWWWAIFYPLYFDQVHESTQPLWPRFWSWSLVEILSVKDWSTFLARGLVESWKLKFGRDFEAEFWPTCDTTKKQLFWWKHATLGSVVPLTIFYIYKTWVLGREGMDILGPVNGSSKSFDGRRAGNLTFRENILQSELANFLQIELAKILQIELANFLQGELASFLPGELANILQRKLPKSWDWTALCFHVLLLLWRWMFSSAQQI